ncbi:MAG: MFS transporter [Candidatus Zixiibacteriota bacterium]|nr:MAG: MFS transporter [candidate division Zixibacteria bacterium]
MIASVAVVWIFTARSGNPVGHSSRFLHRRILNWAPLGVTYALLYMGRYNLTVAKNALGDLMTKSDFGVIFGWGTVVYAFAFILNGPLTDKIGGRRAMLIAAAGAGVMNALMGLFVYLKPEMNLIVMFSVLYAMNMYFQSFGAVAIVKVNSGWFHVRERGVFGGIFGILISLGIFLAFQVGQLIVDTLHTAPGADGGVVVDPPFGVFWIPSALLFLFTAIVYLIVRDRPAQAGFDNFDTGDASSGESDAPDPLRVILKKVVTNPIVLTIAAIEFCTGVLRQGIMHWYIIYGKEMGYAHDFLVTKNWGLMLFIAGATGGMTAGWMSDKLFGSRRAPVAGLLYGLMAVCVAVMAFSLNNPWVLGACVVVISYCVIGTHGVLSGTATMDFGGRKNAGTAVGLIDGMVYLGTGLQSISLGFLTEQSWSFWPPFLLPFAILGVILAGRIWHAMPQAGKKAATGAA